MNLCNCLNSDAADQCFTCFRVRLFAAFSERFFTDPEYMSRKIRKFRRINSIRETAGLLMYPESLKRGTHRKIKARFTLSVV